MNKLDINRIAFIGRTYVEYRDIFSLDDKLLGKGPVLDCPAGAASFAAEAKDLGFDVTACDILYDRSVHELVEKGEEDILHIERKVKEVPELFNWNYYENIDNLITVRRKALDGFSADFRKGTEEGRYRCVTLPALPFPDNHFSLVLSSHFLFLYGDWLEYGFHIDCLKELVRVCFGEVRIYPLSGLDAKPYKYVDRIVSDLDMRGIRADIIEVPFEFQKGSNKMMKLYTSSGGRYDGIQ